MLGSFLSRLLIIGFGSLYPAYSSFKTIRSANVKHYVRWMMYWTVFALFSAAEHVADIFICWLPFYYEIKVLLVLWLMSSYTRGASHVYRKVQWGRERFCQLLFQHFFRLIFSQSFFISSFTHPPRNRN